MIGNKKIPEVLAGDSRIFKKEMRAEFITSFKNASLPPARWSAGSNFRGLTKEHVSELTAYAVAAIHHYGSPPLTQKVAAAHEAGHVVVDYALRETIVSSRIVRRRTARGVVWAGSTTSVAPGCEGKETLALLVHECPSCWFQAVIKNLAGIYGECLLGIDHPSSSIEERWKAAVMASSLDELRGVPEGQTFVKAAEVCGDLLTTNRAAFDAVRTHLFRNGRLTRAGATRMLSDVSRVDLAQFAGGIMH